MSVFKLDEIRQVLHRHSGVVERGKTICRRSGSLGLSVGYMRPGRRLGALSTLSSILVQAMSYTLLLVRSNFDFSLFSNRALRAAVKPLLALGLLAHLRNGGWKKICTNKPLIRQHVVRQKSLSQSFIKAHRG